MVQWIEIDVKRSRELEAERLLREYEAHVFSQEAAAAQEFPCITPSSTTAIFWCRYSSDLEDFENLSKFPYPYPDASAFKNTNRNPYHLVEYEINEGYGLGNLLNEHRNFVEDVEKDKQWLEENGLKADVPFKVRIDIDYYKSGYPGEEDWDMDIDVEIIKE